MDTARQDSPEVGDKQQPSRKFLHPSVVEKLDPAFVQLYNEHIATLSPPPKDIHLLRQGYSSRYAYATAPPTGVGGIGETSVPGWPKYPGDVSVRVYVPPERGGRQVWPCHFNFHGGGWAVGDLDTDAHLCHHICASVPCCVIDVDYRLVPEFPFPTAIMDAMSAVAHILANHKYFSIDPTNITFGGESCGGTISLVLNHLFRDAGLSDRLKGVICGTPIIDDIGHVTVPSQSQYESIRESEFMPLLNFERLKWFDTLKAMSLSSHPEVSRQAKRKDISWFSNILDAPNFQHLAPLTWIGTAEIDPLRDEAETYGEKLKQAGNQVIMKRYSGVPHTFFHMDNVLQGGREYVQDVISHVRICLYPATEDHQPLTDASTPEAPGARNV